MGLRIVTAASEAPVDLADVKRHLRVTDDDEDTLILSMIDGATDLAQRKTNRQFVNQTYEYTRNDWQEAIYLPKPPLSSITSIKYIDDDGVEQTLSTSVYDTFTNVEPGFVRLAWNQSWPSIRSTQDAVKITFVAGYGDSADVPAGIQAAVKLLVGHWYEHRESVDISTMARVTNVPQAFDSLIWSFKVPVV